MTEHQGDDQERAAEFSRERALDSVIKEYIPEDTEFLSGFDFEDRIGAVYGELLDIGEDADVILTEAGVFEEGETDEV